MGERRSIMRIGYTFKELGLHKVKDVDKTKLRKAYEDKDNVIYHNCMKEILSCRFAVNDKEIIRNKIIEAAKAM